MASAERRRISERVSASLIAGLALGACSLQDFDYLQDGKSETVGTGGTGTGGASGTGNTGGSGMQTSGGSPGVGGDAGASGSGSGTGGMAGGSSGDGGMAGMAGVPSGDGGTAGATGGAGGAGGTGGTPGPDVLDNPGFELGVSHSTMPGWTNEGTFDAAFIDFNEARPPSPPSYGRLGHWLQTPHQGYEARTFQEVNPIPNGTYTFRLWIVRVGGGYTEQYIFARGFSADDPDAELRQPTDDPASTDVNGWNEIVIKGIPVTSGKCEVGVYSLSPADTNTWSRMDDAEFVLEEDPGGGGAGGAGGGPEEPPE